MEKIRGKYLFQVLDDELEKVALEWHGNNIDDNPNSQGVFRVSSIEIIFRKLLEEYLDQELSKAREEGFRIMFEGLDNIARNSSEDFYEGVAIIKLRNEITRLSKLKTKEDEK